MSDVFISYSRKDKDEVEKLAKTLESEGFSVWRDHQLLGGEKFAETIERELSRAAAVVVVWTPAALSSRWVQEEAAYAREQNKIIPVTVGSIDPVQLPIGFRAIQSVNIDGQTSDWRERLSAAIKQLVASSASK